MSRPPSDLPQRAVQAAIELAATAGVRNVTFDAVAAQIGASKGAVLHHFRSKGDLIEAMVATLVEEHRAAVEKACREDPEPVGRFARALLRVASPSEIRAERGLLSAMLEEPERAVAVQLHWQWCNEQLAADGIPLMHAAVVMLATDGQWLTDLLGLPQFSESVMTDAYAFIHSLTRPSAESH